MIRVLYKYNRNNKEQTEVIFMLPDDNGKLNSVLTFRYGYMSELGYWWQDLVKKTEAEHEYKMASII